MGLAKSDHSARSSGVSNPFIARDNIRSAHAFHPDEGIEAPGFFPNHWHIAFYRRCAPG